MHRIIIALLLLLNQFSKGQNKRFVYEYSFAQDSTHLDTREKELLNLDIGKTGSKFYAAEMLEQDSLVRIKERPVSKYPYQGIKFLELIIKKYPEFTIDFYTSCQNYYKVNMNKKLNWQISPEKDQFLGMPVQKATTVLNKRKWTVWFTPDIPIQDGPYLFQGLPGLVVKAEDENKGISFTLVAIKSLSVFDLKDIPYYFRFKPIAVNEDVLRKVLKNYYEKPIPTKAGDSNDDAPYYDGSGKELTWPEFSRMVEQNNKNALKKTNNLLRWDIIK